MPKRYLKQPKFPYSHCGLFSKNKKNNEKKKLKWQDIQDTFMKKNQIKLIFIMI